MPLPNFVAIVRQENEERRTIRAPRIATQRIDVRAVEQLRFDASFGGFSLTIDEPPERGGTGAGLPPLAYFLAGAASCLLTQYTKLALEKGIPIQSLKAVARGHFDRQLGGAFVDVIYDIDLESDADARTIKTLASEAELMCYAHNTLKKAVRMETNLKLNGKPLAI